MGLFEDLGERVERFKQQAADASREQADYVCRSCEEPVYTSQEECPHCGSEDVVAVEPDSEAETDAAASNESGSAGESDETADSDASALIDDTETADTGEDGN